MTTGKRIQWHPAFCSAIQLELRDYEECLEYINEYNLTKKPLQIDLLIIKKKNDVFIHHEIGEIFKKYNIIEYKSPDDTLNVDTFFKVVGYACLYKASEKHIGDILETDITITLVRERFPRNFFNWLKKQGYSIFIHSDGIYYIENVMGFFVQIIICHDLSKESSKWLTLLNHNLNRADAKRAILQANSLFHPGERNCADSVLQVALATNREVFNLIKTEGDDTMCDALRELMEPEFTQALTEAKQIAEAEGRAEGRIEGRIEGHAQGRLEGEKDFATLVSRLLKDGLTDILEKITSDNHLREEYYVKYGIRK